MDLGFKGKRALVTGAGKGIGRELVKALCDHEAETYALSRTQDDLDSLKQEYPAVRTVCVDLEDWDATRKAVEDIGPIDLLVNNAACKSISCSFMDTQADHFDTCMNVNVKAVVNVSQVVAKGMLSRSTGGAIVNVSTSISQKIMEGRCMYGASKAALDHVTKSMAIELGKHQIRVNAVNPDIVLIKRHQEYFETEDGRLVLEKILEQAPMGKLLEVKDVVNPILYLLSDKADLINGVTLPVDGGVLAKLR